VSFLELHLDFLEAADHRQLNLPSRPRRPARKILADFTGWAEGIQR